MDDGLKEVLLAFVGVVGLSITGYLTYLTTREKQRLNYKRKLDSERESDRQSNNGAKPTG